MIQDQQVNLARQDVIATPGTAVRRCRHGTMLYLQHDVYVGRSLDQYGALNEINHVKAYPAGVGAAPGTSKVPPLDYGGENNFAGVPIGSAYGEDVPIVTIDSLELPSLRFAKIDVEGMERDVLLGARATIQRLRPVLYIENDRFDRSEALLALLFELGYRVWWHPVPLFARDNFRNNPNNLFGNIVSLNILCLPKEMDAPEPALKEIRTAQERWAP